MNEYLATCMYVYHTVFRVPSEARRVHWIDSLELEVNMVAHWHVSARTGPGLCARAASALNHQAISLNFQCTSSHRQRNPW